MLIKICGLRTLLHARAAAAAGADLLGLVFAPSKRQVTVTEAAALAAALRDGPPPYPRIGGLFVHATPDQINTVASQVGLDFVQLSGDEPPAYADRLHLPILKAIRLDGSPNESRWLLRAVEETTRQRDNETSIPHLELKEVSRLPGSPAPGLPLPRLLLLVDAHVPGAYGGTGMIADWGRAAEVAARVPLVLAGGLNSENVATAIAKVKPLGVDVSSGVETDGVKDVAKIEAFIGAARAAL